jgi:hypothetical protein
MPKSPAERRRFLRRQGKKEQHLENLRRNAQRIAPQYGPLAGLPVNNSASNLAGAAKAEAAPQQASTAELKSVAASAAQEPPSKLKKRLDSAKLIQSILTSAGIIAAGCLFYFQSEFSLKANIKQTIAHEKINDEWIWVHISAEISNIGKRRLDIGNGRAILYTILPLDINSIKQIEEIKPLIEHPIAWPALRDSVQKINKHIYPGETDTIYYEFVVPSFTKTIEIHTFFSETSGKQEGWNKVTVYDLEKRKD